MMNSDEDDNSNDIIAMYESLNPAKRHLIPLEYQAILRSKGYDIPQQKQLPALSKTSGRPPSSSNRLRDVSSAGIPFSNKNMNQLSKLTH